MRRGGVVRHQVIYGLFKEIASRGTTKYCNYGLNWRYGRGKLSAEFFFHLLSYTVHQKKYPAEAQPNTMIATSSYDWGQLTYPQNIMLTTFDGSAEFSIFYPLSNLMQDTFVSTTGIWRWTWSGIRKSKQHQTLATKTITVTSNDPNTARAKNQTHQKEKSFKIRVQSILPPDVWTNLKKSAKKMTNVLTFVIMVMYHWALSCVQFHSIGELLVPTKLLGKSKQLLCFEFGWPNMYHHRSTCVVVYFCDYLLT